MEEITGINHIGLRVRDMDVSREFYGKLGFKFIVGPVGPEPVAIVEHPSGVNINLILNASKDAPDSDKYHEADSRLTVTYNKPIDRFHDPVPTSEGQQTLFSSFHHPGSATVAHLGGANTTSAKVAGMNLLGIAQNDAMKRGYSLTPDTNLSEHSDNLVGRLQGKGMVDKDFSKEGTNYMEFGTSPYAGGEGTGVIPSGEVNRGRRTVRSVLGRKNNPTTKQPEQPEQLSLDT